ncbi:ABC transporter ATP-binding protein [Bacillus sp. sid0103]|uniref:ABC transporter ATP-binding protein n=1 Tax=Bacillus sp. sid0103 TaxID=2856337 RepID=UPI001C448BBB|nr:ABC transporter ATP-binding protein [Bacillus sp. sid0103]MBV7505309.1 ABC transporter ATP-binding protein [Bacillus sp. sid0103]
MEGHLLEIKGLKTHFQTERGRVTAVDGISFHVDRGEVLAIVGESGCGKSVTAQSILRLFEENGVTTYEGEINFEGKNLLDLPVSEMRKIRGNDISMIFQDPLSSLNPVFTIGDQIMEPIMLHQKLSRKEAYQRALDMLKLIGIPAPEQRIEEYPHQISGGMRQRVMIAIALACQPKLLIADEPTTALDVTIQSQILELIDSLRQELDMGIMLITHDLGVVAQHCTRVAVMYLGEVVEEGDVDSLFENPLHPYTKGLIHSIPQLYGDRNKKLSIIKGMVPSLNEIPKGCRFAPRCPFADTKCMDEKPELESLDDKKRIKCWHYKEIEGAMVNAT